MKYIQTFEAKKWERAKTLANQLMKAENDWRKSAGVSSSDPVWEDSDIRRDYMKTMDNVVSSIGVDIIKEKSDKILKRLLDNGYHQLSIFLILRKYVDSPNYQYYVNKSKEKSNKDSEAFLDFMFFKKIPSVRQLKDFRKHDASGIFSKSFLPNKIIRKY